MNVSSVPPPKRRRREHLLRYACVLALVALVLIVWSVIVPTPLPVLVALSVGQALGTASFLMYLLIVASDVRLKRTLESMPPRPPSAADEPPPSSHPQG